MKNRKAAIKQMQEWIAAEAASFEIMRIVTQPHIPVDPEKLNSVHIHKGIDQIIKKSSRSRHGYPALRACKVIFEVWVKEGSDPEAVCQDIRDLLLSKTLDNDCSVFEDSIFGPFDGGVPGAQAMQLTMELRYLDAGPTIDV